MTITTNIQEIGYVVFFVEKEKNVPKGSKRLEMSAQNRDEAYGYDYYKTTDGHYIAVENQFNALFD